MDRITTRTLRLVITALLVAVAGEARPKPVEPTRAVADWIDVQSPHFRVLSNDREDKAVRIALEFEQTREVFRSALLNAKSDPGQPIVILAVKDEPSLIELLPELMSAASPPSSDKTRQNRVPGGVFRRGADKHFILVRTDLTGPNRYRSIYHEYFHLLTSLNLRRIPMWLSEGLAEFWELTRIGSDEVELGQPDPGRIQYLKREGVMPLAQLLGTETNPHESNRDQVGVFYAQAWALTHFLMIGDDGGANRQKLGLYLERINRGEKALTAFENEFGDLKTVEAKLSAYLDRKKHRALAMDAPTRPSTDSVRVFPLTPAQVHAWKASFLVLGSRYDASLPHLAAALELSPQSALAHDTMALYQLYAGKEDVAKQWFEKACALGSQSFLSRFYAGLANRDTAPERVRSHLMEAIRLNPLFAPAYLELARFEAEHSAKPERVANLARKAVEIQPDNAVFWAQLSYLFLKIGWLDDAHSASQRAKALASTPKEHSIAGLLSRRLEEASGDDARSVTNTYADASLSGRELTHSSLESVNSPSESGPTFRQVEGALIEARCFEDGRREFVVRAADERLILGAASDADFILLNEDGTSVAFPKCGRLSQPVRATFRTDATETGGTLLTLELQNSSSR